MAALERNLWCHLMNLVSFFFNDNFNWKLGFVDFNLFRLGESDNGLTLMILMVFLRSSTYERDFSCHDL